MKTWSSMRRWPICPPQIGLLYFRGHGRRFGNRDELAWRGHCVQGNSVGLGLNTGRSPAPITGRKNRWYLILKRVSRILGLLFDGRFWFGGDPTNAVYPQSYLSASNKLWKRYQRSFFGWTGAQNRISVSVSPNIVRARRGTRRDIPPSSNPDLAHSMSIMKVSTGTVSTQYYNDWGGAASAGLRIFRMRT